MKKILKMGSYFGAICIVIVAFASVVAYQSIESTQNDSNSPLFIIRTQRAIEKASEKRITFDYLGKGKTLSLFSESSSMYRAQLDKAFKILIENPVMIQKLIKRISQTPQMTKIFQQHGLSIARIQQTLAMIKENPEILQNQLNTFYYPVNISNDQQPLGLDTSSIIGCFITVLILLPIAILIGVLIATITIITCLNLGDCFSTLLQAILTGMTQGLDQP